MRDEQAQKPQIAGPAWDDAVANLTAPPIGPVRACVRAGIDQIKRGEYTTYVGREGLKELSAGVKERGRRLLGRDPMKA
jgi:hypothetical protein